jgi:hypothetical protein
MKMVIIVLMLLSIHFIMAEDSIPITGSYNHSSPVGTWSRGMATTMYCGNSPESWIRGNATFDRSTGILIITVQLETDDVLAGPKGKVIATLKDNSGKTLTTVFSEEVGTGGKPPGRAAIRNFISHIKIDDTIAKKVALIHLDAKCTGSLTRLWNLGLDNVIDVFAAAAIVIGTL